MSDQKTRRFFLGALTAASAVRVWGANDKVNVGIVGLGGRGSSHLNTYTSLNEAQVIALCDVNQAAREKAQATLARKNLDKAREFEDMRQLFADPVFPSFACRFSLQSVVIPACSLRHRSPTWSAWRSAPNQGRIGLVDQSIHVTGWRCTVG